MLPLLSRIFSFICIRFITDIQAQSISPSDLRVCVYVILSQLPQFNDYGQWYILDSESSPEAAYRTIEPLPEMGNEGDPTATGSSSPRFTMSYIAP